MLYRSNMPFPDFNDMRHITAIHLCGGACLNQINNQNQKQHEENH